jgi:hypothetical protein
MPGLLLACNHAGSVDQKKEAVMSVEMLIIQPVGGFTGGGTPGSHFQSEGRLALSSLAPQDQMRIKALFSAPAPEKKNFYYRITLEGPNGTKTVDASPETVPEALIDSIQTRLE